MKFGLVIPKKASIVGSFESTPMPSVETVDALAEVKVPLARVPEAIVDVPAKFLRVPTIVILPPPAKLFEKLGTVPA